MKAIQIQKTGSFDSLKLVNVNTPIPNESQVLVRMKAASVNFADTMLRKGTYSAMPALPTIPGLEGSGIVEKVGPKVTHVQPGKPVIVCCSHCYAEYVVADADSVFPISEGIDLDEAATLSVAYLTAYHLLHTMARISAGQTLLVHAAAGGVGRFGISIRLISGGWNSERFSPSALCRNSKPGRNRSCAMTAPPTPSFVDIAKHVRGVLTRLVPLLTRVIILAW